MPNTLTLHTYIFLITGILKCWTQPFLLTTWFGIGKSGSSHSTQASLSLYFVGSLWSDLYTDLISTMQISTGTFICTSIFIFFFSPSRHHQISRNGVPSAILLHTRDSVSLANTKHITKMISACPRSPPDLKENC